MSCELHCFVLNGLKTKASQSNSNLAHVSDKSSERSAVKRKKKTELILKTHKASGSSCRQDEACKLGQNPRKCQTVLHNSAESPGAHLLPNDFGGGEANFFLASFTG